MTMPPGHRRSATRVGLGVGLRSFLLRTVRAGHWRQGHDVFLSSGSRASRRSSPTLAQSLARSADLSLEPCPTAGVPSLARRPWTLAHRHSTPLPANTGDVAALLHVPVLPRPRDREAAGCEREGRSWA